MYFILILNLQPYIADCLNRMNQSDDESFAYRSLKDVLAANMLPSYRILHSRQLCSWKYATLMTV